MKIIIASILSLFALTSMGVERNMKVTTWFKDTKCEHLKITKYKSHSDKTVIKEIKISDTEYITSFQLEISRLPLSGTEMIKMGPDADYSVLEFQCKDGVEKVEFFNHKIKTPDTSFYSEELEKSLWEEIQSLLDKPKLDRPLPLIKNHPYDFQTFSISCIGYSDRTPKGTTASSFASSFKLVDNSNKSEKIIDVTSGQLPPGPLKFKVGSENLVLGTFKAKNGERLPSRVFIIYKE